MVKNSIVRSCNIGFWLFIQATYSTIYDINKAKCVITYNPIQHDRIKYIKVDRFFIKNKIG